MPLPNWNAVRRSLVSAIKAALPLQVMRAGNDRVAGVGLHMDAYYGSAGLYLLPEGAAHKLEANALDNIGDWPISTDWVENDDYSVAFAEHWRPWDKWFYEHLDSLTDVEMDEKFRSLLRVSCEAIREVELAGYFDAFAKCDGFKVIIAEHDEPDVFAVNRYESYLKTGKVQVFGEVRAD